MKLKLKPQWHEQCARCCWRWCQLFTKNTSVKRYVIWGICYIDGVCGRSRGFLKPSGRPEAIFCHLELILLAFLFLPINTWMYCSSVLTPSWCCGSVRTNKGGCAQTVRRSSDFFCSLPKFAKVLRQEYVPSVRHRKTQENEVHSDPNPNPLCSRRERQQRQQKSRVLRLPKFKEIGKGDSRKDTQQTEFEKKRKQKETQHTNARKIATTECSTYCELWTSNESCKVSLSFSLWRNGKGIAETFISLAIGVITLCALLGTAIATTTKQDMNSLLWTVCVKLIEKGSLRWSSLRKCKKRQRTPSRRPYF